MSDSQQGDRTPDQEPHGTEQGRAHEQDHDDEAMAMPEELRDIGQGTSSEGGAPLP